LWERTRALESIMDDYLGPIPRFNSDDVKRMLRISRANYDMICNILCNADPFFHDAYDAQNCRSICVDAKILTSLKYICYGTAINSFRDYFQMGGSISWLCLKHIVEGITACDDIRGKKNVVSRCKEGGANVL